MRACRGCGAQERLAQGTWIDGVDDLCAFCCRMVLYWKWQRKTIKGQPLQPVTVDAWLEATGGRERP